MLSTLLCSSPQMPDDFDRMMESMYPPTSPTPTSKKAKRRTLSSLSFSSVTFLTLKSSVNFGPKATKQRVKKANIGAPQDFKHEMHVGRHNLHELQLPEVWNIDDWGLTDNGSDKSSSLEVTTPPPITLPAVLPPPPRPPRSKSRPTTAQSTMSTITVTSMAAGALPSPPRRKPVPSLLPDEATTIAATKAPAVEVLPLLFILPVANVPGQQSESESSEQDKVEQETATVESTPDQAIKEVDSTTVSIGHGEEEAGPGTTTTRDETRDRQMDAFRNVVDNKNTADGLEGEDSAAEVESAI